MNKVVVQFYNHIYHTYNDSLLLIYDTINNEYYTLAINKENFTVQDGNIITIENPQKEESKSLIDTINRNHLGIIGGPNDKYFKYNDYVAYINKLEKYITPNSNNTYIASYYINEITIYMDSLYEPFSLTDTIKDVSNLTPICKDQLIGLFAGFGFKSLAKVNFIGAFASYLVLKDFIYALLDRCEVEYMCSVNEYTKISQTAPKNLKLNVIIDETITFQKLFPEISNLVKTTFIIKKEADIHFLENEELHNVKEPTIIFSCTGDTSYLKRYLNYSVDDIFDSPIPMNQIIKNELINELYWGKLTITSDGRLLSFPKKDIGNINTPDKIDLCKLLEKDSLWKYNRKKNNYCGSCCFNCLCPSLSLVEIMSNQIFCNFKNIIV